MNILITQFIKRIVAVLVVAICGVVMTFMDAEALDRAPMVSVDSPIATVTGDLASEWSITRNFDDIVSRIPSINTQQTGSASGIASFNLRGQTDQHSTLMLVNGQRVVSSSLDINTEDISRVEVIRDASASAIYGSDAVAGVINIITKKPQEESRNSFTNLDTSQFTHNPYQSGYRAMATAETDPIGQALSAFYSSGGSIGADAGDMFASTVKLRWDLGGPLCDSGYTASQQWQWPAEQAAGCLSDEMLEHIANIDDYRGTTTSDQVGGEYITQGLTGLGFDSQLASSIATSRFPQFTPAPYGFFAGGPIPRTNFGSFDRTDGWWNAGLEGDYAANFNTNPVLLDHFLHYSPGGKHVMPDRDNNPWTLDLAFGEQNFGRYYKETFKPNDPLYKKPDTAGRKLGGALKKGFGALLSVSGVGIGTTNNDSRSEDQWGLHAAGYTPMGTGSAWDVIDGRKENVVVAVIDSGLDLSHPDRPKYIWHNQGEIPGNNIDDDTNGYVDDINGWNFVDESNNIDDDYGHGTFVAGIIAANTDNGVGIAGVNPGARMMTLKVGSRDGLPRSLAIYRALRYAVDNGARVINISLGNKELSRLEQIGINYAYAMGCVVVVAAGNESSDIAQYGPAGARRVFTVSSLNVDGSRRSQSNKGLMVAVAAPGESIYSLTAKNGKRDGRIIPIMAGEYHRLSGTSFAAPIVAGTASLILAKNPNLTNREVEDMILASAVDVEKPGWDAETGMGKLNARYALTINPETAFAPRITEWIINRDKRGKVSSVDVYGVIRGPVASYEIGVGQGTSPKEWTPAFGPANRLVQHGHIARLPGNFFKKDSSWSLQLSAKALDGQNRVQQVVVRNKR